MKITFVAPIADMSGGARVIHIYAKLLRERGHEVAVVTRPRALSFRKRMRSLVNGERWPGRISKISYFDDLSYRLILVDDRRPILSTDVPNADVVIATWWETAEWVAKFPRTKGRMIHFVQHYEAFKNIPKARVDAVLRLPSYKITISGWLEQMLRHRFDNKNVSLIPNSVDFDQFSAPPRRRQEVPTIGTVYTETPWKDCRTALRAFDLLRQEMPQARLVTFGQTKPSFALRLPEGTRHLVLPRQDCLRFIYASCDVWICSSIIEGFGLPALEAMACRCPVVSTLSGGPNDFIRDKINGYLVPVGDAEAIADKVRSLLTIPQAAWCAMSDAAYDTATRYTWSDAADRFEVALNKAAASAGSEFCDPLLQMNEGISPSTYDARDSTE